MANLICWIMGHKRIRPTGAKKAPSNYTLLAVTLEHDKGIRRLNVYMCERCRLLYWEPLDVSETDG